jgi:hypothetical protein
MKGQVFLIGAILLCTLFYMGLPLSGPSASSAPLGDLDSISGNLKSEFPLSLNLGLAEGRPVPALADFTLFAASVMESKFSGFRAFWLVSEPEGTGINLTAGNFLGEPAQVTLDVAGDVRTLTLDDGQVESLGFGPVPPEFALSASFPGGSTAEDWDRDKHGLYVYYAIEREGDVVAGEVRG